MKGAVIDLLARKYESTYQLENKSSPKKTSNNRKKVRTKTRSLSKLGTIVLVMIISSIGIAFLSGYAKITAIRTEINEMEDVKEELENKKINLKAELEGIKSSDLIMEEASLKLGMNIPAEDQILHISVPKDLKPKKGLELYIDKLYLHLENIKNKIRR